MIGKWVLVNINISNISYYKAETVDEPLLKVSKAQKWCRKGYRRRCRPVSDCTNLLGVQLETSIRGNEPQEGDFYAMELTLLWIY